MNRGNVEREGQGEQLVYGDRPALAPPGLAGPHGGWWCLLLRGASWRPAWDWYRHDPERMLPLDS